MQLSIESVNESHVGAFGERDPFGAQKWNIPESPADDAVRAGLDSFDIVGCTIGDGILYKCQGFC